MSAGFPGNTHKRYGDTGFPGNTHKRYGDTGFPSNSPPLRAGWALRGEEKKHGKGFLQPWPTTLPLLSCK